MDHNLFVRRADWHVENGDPGHYRPYRSLYGHRVRRKRIYGHHFTHVMYGGHNSRLLFQKKSRLESSRTAAPRRGSRLFYRHLG